ncbi:polysaccharide deacetylase family protein [Pseudoalteromonas fenneropenaei]|uniref:Polysaccharide deacetylase family protein n=1 Tax=Pseudoalteromonas fenneropenaei TaxID=1737459 RepID=A0ABV7CLX7_9GAMM
MKLTQLSASLAAVLFSSVLAAQPSDDKVIFLTFDDGPINATSALVDALTEADIKATFFINAFHMYGEGDENEDMAAAAMRKVFDAGHVVANHSYDHMLHNCTDGVRSGAEYCNEVGLWPVKSYQNVESDYEFFALNTEKLLALIPDAELYPNFKMRTMARLPYTNGWRVTSVMKGDGLCATSDTVPPWDPAFNCTPATSTNSSQVAIQITDKLAANDYKVYGWDFDWGPENWGVAFPAETMADGVAMVANMESVINQCNATVMNPLNSRTPNLDCSDGIAHNKVVILTHDFLFEDGPRGQGATINLPKLKAFAEQARAAGYRFDTMDNYAPAWQATTVYELGEFVSYQDKIYSVLQAHTSQANWQPTATPALWTLEK